MKYKLNRGLLVGVILIITSCSSGSHVQHADTASSIVFAYVEYEGLEFSAPKEGEESQIDSIVEQIKVIPAKKDKSVIREVNILLKVFSVLYPDLVKKHSRFESSLRVSPYKEYSPPKDHGVITLGKGVIIYAVNIHQGRVRFDEIDLPRLPSQYHTGKYPLVTDPYTMTYTFEYRYYKFPENSMVNIILPGIYFLGAYHLKEAPFILNRKVYVDRNPLFFDQRLNYPTEIELLHTLLEKLKGSSWENMIRQRILEIERLK